ncbi:MAG: hypothetical protein Q8Q12_20190 [bacterium]|nr:hypothetical protein [bacterium]
MSFWFDTEDYILPAADDAAKRLAEIFTEQGVRATFKIVGEKARVLRDRKRDDVIHALSKHDIGYHAEYHSVHPTPAEYEQQLGWDEGVKAFMRREGRGVEDLMKIFGVVPSCYGQAGGSWVPQSYAALRNWEIPIYLDETSHVGLDGKPFWYCGVLNVLNLDWRVTRTGLGGEGDFQEGCQQFDEVHKRVLDEGGGLISIYYHPCEWVHKQFWDGVNFSRGANPPREEWKLPPQKSPEETERAFEYFARYLEHVRTRPNVQLITAREMGALYPDRAYQRPFTRDELLLMAKHIQKEVTFLRLGDRAVSAAEILYLLAKAVVRFDKNPPPKVQFLGARPDERRLQYAFGSSPLAFRIDDIDLKFLYGPSSTWSETIQESTFSWKRWGEACCDFLEEVEDLGRIPPVIWVAGKAVAPEDFAATLGWGVERLSEQNLTSWTGTEFPGLKEVSLKKGNFTAGKYVAEDRPGLWGWVIFPPGLRCPKMMELGRLQAWTIKPAILTRP